MSNALVVTEGLSKVYSDHEGGEIRAVDSLDLSCYSGEIFGLLGLNGAGKTTTMRMLSTALTPTRGTATVCGHDVREDARQVRASIGFLSGTTGLYHRLTAKEMIETFGRLHGMDARQLKSRVDEVLALFEIDKYADMRCEKLSTGMKQKVNIARAIVHDPPVLIFDEPTSGLDVLAASTTLDFVLKLRDLRKCVVYSTHIMSEVERLCDRIAIIHDGKLQGLGSLEDLRANTGRHYLEDIFRDLVQEEPV